MKIHWSGNLPVACALVISTASCWIGPSGGPVPIKGTQEEISALSGEWTGRYWSEATGRHGTIRFTLPEQADTGFGEVKITFSPALSLAKQSSAVESRPSEDLQPSPCTVIEITLVKVEDGRVRGTMAPYWDPDCNCRSRTIFEGRLSGNRIGGTFTTRRESADRRLLGGQWQVDRKPS